MRLSYRRAGVAGRDRRGAGQGGFTLLELIVAMTVLGLLSVAIYGVVSLGATSADSGERITEQARRLRLATALIVRQLRSTEPMQLPQENGLLPFFYGEESLVEFVTASPQSGQMSGLSVVRYWLEDGELKMSEMPIYAAMRAQEGGLDFDNPDDTVQTVLLYNVDSVHFSYVRDAEQDWEDTWDASELDELPAAVRIEITPSTPDGPDWYHEVPIMVGVFNQIADSEDFRRPPQSVADSVQSESPPDTTTNSVDDGGDDQVDE